VARRGEARHVAATQARLGKARRDKELSMNVTELIEILRDADPDAVVKLSYDDEHDETVYADVDNVLDAKYYPKINHVRIRVMHAEFVGESVPAVVIQAEP